MSKLTMLLKSNGKNPSCYKKKKKKNPIIVREEEGGGAETKLKQMLQPRNASSCVGMLSGDGPRAVRTLALTLGQPITV